MTEPMVGIVPERLAPVGMRGNGIALDFARQLIADAEAGRHVAQDRLDAAQSLLRRSGPAPSPAMRAEVAA